MIFDRRLTAVARCLSLSTLIGVGATAAFAQTASQVTKESYAPPVVRPVQGGIDLPIGGGPEAPAGAAKLAVTPAGLQVEGAIAELAAETAVIEARLKGKRVTGADLFAAARDLEAAYARAGYLLVRVTLPPQTIRDGMPLKLVVTDGHIEAIETSALPENVRGRIDAILGSLIGRTGLTRQELERRLLLAGDTPGVVLKSTLKAGTKPGSTVIVVDGRYNPVTTSISADNGLSDDLGTYASTLGFDFNSVLGLGELVYTRLSGYPGFNQQGLLSDDPRNRQIVLGMNLPLGTDGWWLNVEGVDSKTHPTSGLGYTMRDEFQRFSVKTGYSWLRSRDVNASTIVGFDVADEDQDIQFGGVRVPFTSDKLRVLRLTQTADAFTSLGGIVSGSMTASFGLDAFGARHGTARLPLSRDGAEPDFTKLDVTARYSQSFFQEQVLFSLAGKAQTSFGQALAASEQFALGGFDWLSAYNGGSMQADTGAAFRAELAFPTVLSPIDTGQAIGGSAAPYVFLASGIAKLEQPSAVEKSISRAASFGAGIRFSLSDGDSVSSAALVVEYARGEASNAASEDRFNLRISTRF